MVSTNVDKAVDTRRCWVCGSDESSHWKERNLDRPLTPEDFQITDSRYGVTWSLWQCQKCSFIFADGSELAELTGFYEQLVDPSYEEGAENRALQMRWLLQVGRNLKPDGRTLLEIGAGTGLLIREAQKMGLEAVGIEPSVSLVEAAHQINDVRLIQGIFPHTDVAERRFDFIFLVDVIEHVSDPVQLLRDSANALTDSGLLVVVTPDIGSVAARLLRKRWWHLRLAHVGYFNDRSMAQAAKSAGLSIQGRYRARWFFKIGYLAERLQMYLPISAVNRAAMRLRPLRGVYESIIPLNLHDSTVFCMRRHIN